MTLREERKLRAAEEAEAWLERLERTLRPDEVAPLREWLKVRPHRDAIIARCNLWHGPEILAVLATLFPVDMAPPPPNRWLGQVALTAFSAVVWLGVIVTIVVLWTREDASRTPFGAGDSYRTAVHGQRVLRLSDGSSVMLNTATYVLANIGTRSREVTLVDGEATFDVTKDPARPFQVRAGSRQFECGPDGGRFNIRRLSDTDVEITLVRGSIKALVNADAAALTPAQVRSRFSAGAHTFHASEGGLLGPGWVLPGKLDKESMERRLAWQRGRIILVDEMLEDALKEVERYTTTRFVLVDDGLRRLRVSAEFRTGDIDAVLRLLRDTLHVESRADENGDFLLSLSTQP